MQYRKYYGWTSATPGSKPDFRRCAATVASRIGGGNLAPKQCAFSARYNPDESGNPTTCRLHRHE